MSLREVIQVCQEEIQRSSVGRIDPSNLCDDYCELDPISVRCPLRSLVDVYVLVVEEVSATTESRRDLREGY